MRNNSDTPISGHSSAGQPAISQVSSQPPADVVISISGDSHDHPHPTGVRSVLSLSIPPLNANQDSDNDSGYGGGSAANTPPVDQPPTLSYHNSRHCYQQGAWGMIKWGGILVLYVTPLCVVFHQLSAPSGETAAMLAVTANAPVAIVFAKEFIEKLRAYLNCKKNTKLAVILFSSGIAAGALTGISSLGIVDDALKSSFSSALYYYCKGVFFTNTLTTRSVAWPLVIHNLIQAVSQRCCQKTWPLYQFLRDLEANFTNSGIQQIKANSYKDFVSDFYLTLESQKINPKSWSCYDFYRAVEKTVSVLCLALLPQFFALFQQLGADGLANFSEQMAEKCYSLISPIALINIIFYAYSIWNYIPALRCTLEDLIMRAYHSSISTTGKAITITGGLMAIFGSQAIAYLSGEGMENVIRQFDETPPSNTSSCIYQHNLFALDSQTQAFMTKLTAGLVCNGLGALYLIKRYFLNACDSSDTITASEMRKKISSLSFATIPEIQKQLGDGIFEHIATKRKECIEGCVTTYRQSGEHQTAQRPSFCSRLCTFFHRNSQNSETTPLLDATNMPSPQPT